MDRMLLVRPGGVSLSRIDFDDAGAFLDGARVESTVLVAAHPDDEVIGVGCQLRKLGRLTILHVTDGAPENGLDAQRAGFRTPFAYAAARKRELGQALKESGARGAQTLGLELHDQEASLYMVEMAMQLTNIFTALRPQLVLTHPYEGGHPDHDATAFGVHAACRLVGKPPVLAEFTSYHAGPRGLCTGEFLPGGKSVTTVVLSPEDRERKRRMLNCYRTQRGMLAHFGIEREPVRVAPEYSFTEPPHEGKVYYEQCDWGMTGERFRSLAQRAIRVLGLSGGAF